MEKYIIILSTIVLATTGLSNEPIRTVDNLDIAAYMGRWYQVAAIPASFQKKCAGESFADYSKNTTGIKITNTCSSKDGSKRVAKAQARINSKYSINSKLELTFVNIFGKWIWVFGGDYWVLDLDEQYTYSVVGTPKRDYLWVLSRTPSMSRETLQELEIKIKNQLFDTCKIEITQAGELNKKKLCSLSNDIREY